MINKQVKVAFISSSFPADSEDWKSIFIRQMLFALSDEKELRLKYWGPPGDLPRNTEYSCLESEEQWFMWLMDNGGLIHLVRQKNHKSIIAPVRQFIHLRNVYRRSEDIDVYHVNWLQNALPIPKSKTPLLITVLGSDYALLGRPGMTKLLRRVLKGRPSVIAPNADWMISDLKEKFGDVAKIKTLPLGINSEWFDVDRTCSFTSPHKWLTVSRLTKKKIGPLFDWGKTIFENSSEHELHLFGPLQEELSIPAWVKYHGPTDPETLCRKWFPEVTGLISLSEHDEGRPQVMLEAMAAKIPIIASDLKAHRNFIVNRKTGLLVNSFLQFEESIQALSSPENNTIIANSAFSWVQQEIGTWRDAAKRYSDVYRALLSEQV